MPKALVIDDDPVVAKTIHRMLRIVIPHDWTVLHETDARVALSVTIIDQDVGLVIVDLLMPGLDGEQLIGIALDKRPSLRGKIVVCSGAWYTLEQTRRLFSELGCERLDKPFRLEELEQVAFRVIMGQPPNAA